MKTGPVYLIVGAAVAVAITTGGLACRATGAAGTGAGAGGAGGAGGDTTTVDAATGGAGGSGGATAPDAGAPGPTVVETLDVTDVWSGHPVAFSLVTRGNQQFAAFYAANEQMTVAQRTLGDTSWKMAA